MEVSRPTTSHTAHARYIYNRSKRWVTEDWRRTKFARGGWQNHRSIPDIIYTWTPQRTLAHTHTNAFSSWPNRLYMYIAIAGDSVVCAMRKNKGAWLFYAFLEWASFEECIYIGAPTQSSTIYIRGSICPPRCNYFWRAWIIYSNGTIYKNLRLAIDKQ